jgi:protein transport protein SEC31
LTRLFNETSEALGGSRANPAKKREIEDNSRKLGALFANLNSGDISKNASDKLVQLCQALDSGDFSTALQIQVHFYKIHKLDLGCKTRDIKLPIIFFCFCLFQVHITTTEWDECNFWLATLKRMIKTRQNVRIN